jgi:hypothetical protein
MTIGDGLVSEAGAAGLVLEFGRSDQGELFGTLYRDGEPVMGVQRHDGDLVVYGLEDGLLIRRSATSNGLFAGL